MSNKNAGFTIRLFASFVDTSIMVFLILIVPVYVYYLLTRSQGISAILNSLTFMICLLFFWGILHLFYQIYLTSRYGGTLGKILCGLRVKDADSDKNLSLKTSFLRHTAGYAFSSQFFGLGFLRIVRNDNKFGWHDELFNTKVTKEGSWWLGLITLLIVTALEIFFITTLA